MQRQRKSASHPTAPPSHLAFHCCDQLRFDFFFIGLSKRSNGFPVLNLFLDLQVILWLSSMDAFSLVRYRQRCSKQPRKLAYILFGRRQRTEILTIYSDGHLSRLHRHHRHASHLRQGQVSESHTEHPNSRSRRPWRLRRSRSRANWRWGRGLRRTVNNMMTRESRAGGSTVLQRRLTK